MKSRISFFDKAILRKDITRFAPLWAIYFIGGLLVMLTNLSGLKSGASATYLVSTLGPFSIINMIYAALCAQLLFGDLFNSRMCNALHALPMRRETWFATHTLSGVLFSLVPHAVCMTQMMFSLRDMWYMSLVWVLGMGLEYLFFFGLAVFSVFCTGNRFAMVAVYGILNFASMIAYWFVTTMYQPLLSGVQFETDIFVLLCPVVQMCTTELTGFIGSDSGWWYLAVCALVGIGLLVASLLLYRSRELECAGDFIAVKPVEPVFAVVFTICVGCVFAVVQQLFTSEDYLLFLCAGLVVGWFVGQMLLQRTVRVFKGKSFLRLAILAATLGASLLLTWLDPLGITRWVPEADRVSVVYVDTGKYVSPGEYNCLELREKEKISAVTEAHHLRLQSNVSNGRKQTMTICYQMKDGRKISRTYSIYSGTREWNILEELYRSPQHLLRYKDWEDFIWKADIRLEQGRLGSICDRYVRFSGLYEGKDLNLEVQLLHQELKRSLLEAIRKDCEEGLLPQTMQSDIMEYKWWVDVEVPGSDNPSWGRNINVFSISHNTLAWMEQYKHIVCFIPPSVT